ncbi:Uncharacterised protein [Segatella copri]|nr:Uncharacterised protein [Segatella copri]
MFSLADTCRGASVKSSIAIKRNCLRCFIFFNSYFCLLINCSEPLMKDGSFSLPERSRCSRTREVRHRKGQRLR